MHGLQSNGDHKVEETSQAGLKRPLDDLEEPASAKKRKVTMSEAQSDQVLVVEDEGDGGGAIVIDD